MGSEAIPKILREYRKKNHYRVQDVSLLLAEHSITATPKTIYAWEAGLSHPSADTLLTLCEIYQITDVLKTFSYRQESEIHLSQKEKALVLSYRAHPERQEAVDILLLRKKGKSTKHEMG